MIRTREQIEKNKQLWDAITARNYAQALNSGYKLLDDPAIDNFAFKAHVAMQLVHAHKALAHQLQKPSTSARHWQEILTLIQRYYPVGKEPEIIAKNEAWFDVLPEEESPPRDSDNSGHIHAWQDVIDELKTMAIVCDSQSLRIVSSALLSEILRQAAKTGFDRRVMQIFAIKKGKYIDAREAYARFVKEYGVGTEAGMFDQQAQLSRIMQERARHEQDTETQKLAHNQLAQLQAYLDKQPLSAETIARQKILEQSPSGRKLLQALRTVSLSMLFSFGAAVKEASAIRFMGMELAGAEMVYGFGTSYLRVEQKRVRS